MTPCNQAGAQVPEIPAFCNFGHTDDGGSKLPVKSLKVSNKPSDEAFQKTVVSTGVTWLMIRKGVGHRTWVLGALSFEGVKLENRGRLVGTIP